MQKIVLGLNDEVEATTLIPREWLKEDVDLEFVTMKELMDRQAQKTESGEELNWGILKKYDKYLAVSPEVYDYATREKDESIKEKSGETSAQILEFKRPR